MYPSYLESYNNGKLKLVTEQAFAMLESCCICPRKCKVNRLKDQLGFCKTGVNPGVCSYMAHQGEEPPISGANGSGTIFFSRCNMACVYCQNYEFSQLGQGKEVSFDELAGFMLELQKMSCHNINLVSPTHIMPQILKALELAIPKGLTIPIVYNTGGYELPEILKLLDGIVDIYLPDMRYADSDLALQYSSAPDYARHNQDAVGEMHRQVGIANIDDKGIVKRGMIVRHLVLPNGISGTEKIMKFIAQDISKDTYISLMSQYLPYFNASGYKDISRRLTHKEYKFAKEIMQKYGLSNGWIQESYGLERFAGVHIKQNLLNDT